MLPGGGEHEQTLTRKEGKEECAWKKEQHVQAPAVEGNTAKTRDSNKVSGAGIGRAGGAGGKGGWTGKRVCETTQR